MANGWIAFWELLNPPGTEQNRVHPFRDAVRFQQSLLSGGEKRLLLWLGARVPESVNSDHLTGLGFAGQLGAGASYALASSNHWWLLAVVACLGINWLGDSLDGTVARLRRKQRPRYGFYLDHMVDSIGALALMAGLALSGYMHPFLAIALLVTFLLLSIQSYLAAYTLAEFHLSFWHFGPTELRLLLSAGSVALLRWPTVLKAHYRLFDIGGVIALAGMTVMLIYAVGNNCYRLYQQERVG
jgi:archaetidylinositol phosphate synthase